jgi:hypothetical protein
MPRITFLFLLLFVLNGYVASAQHPLIGTWEMVSISGVNVDGEKFNLDSATTRETKIITPTHYMLIAMSKQDGEWKFNRSYFGSIKIEGGKYYEFPIMSSEQIYENLKTDFDWKIDGDAFIQSGVITRPDGKKIILDRFLFGRSKTPEVSGQNFAGTWQADQGGVKSYLVVTATHWMVIEKRDQKFSKALGGAYNVKGNRAELGVLYGTKDTKSISAELKGQQIVINDRTYSRLR